MALSAGNSGPLVENHVVNLFGALIGVTGLVKEGHSEQHPLASGVIGGLQGTNFHHAGRIPGEQVSCLHEV
jgi:hypothetical protein